MEKQDFALNISKSIIFQRKAFALAFVLIFVLTPVALANEPTPAAGESLPLGNVPTRLVISSIALDREIFPVGWTSVVSDGVTVDKWDTLDNDVAWHNESAKLGEVGNTVLNGHSDVHARVFRNLINVEIGDEIIVFSGEHPYHYVVTKKILVGEKGVSYEQRVANAQLIAPTEDERLTLVTCAGPDATHRLIVIARPATRATQ
jgi:LPXTG-site transpeptidase (sortase) family protein